jgi:SAM-dependent methyltransferase
MSEKSSFLPSIRFLLNPEVRLALDRGGEADLLDAYEQVWRRKRVLAKVYETWYRMIWEELREGVTLEVGAGTGNFKKWLGVRGRRCWTLDVLRGRHVDVQADALHFPFYDGTVTNIVMIDALHHLARPLSFLSCARRLLLDGGRVILVEPHVSLWGRIVYRYLHHEEVDFGFEESQAAKKAWAGNAAIPDLILAKEKRSGTDCSLSAFLRCLKEPPTRRARTQRSPLRDAHPPALRLTLKAVRQNKRSASCFRSDIALGEYQSPLCHVCARRGPTRTTWARLLPFP